MVLTSDKPWDPGVLDGEPPDVLDWYDTVSDLSPNNGQFDAVGNYRLHAMSSHCIADGEESASAAPTTICDLAESASAFHTPNFVVDGTDGHQVQCQLHDRQARTPDYKRLRPFFLHATADVVKRTFEATTQYARSVSSGKLMKKIFRSPFPALNVHRRREAVATDTVYSDTPAIDNGSEAAQIFIGRESLVADVYGVKTDKQFVKTLEDNIRRRGAMDKLISDGAKAEVSKRAHDILRSYCIEDWQSEPHYQHQNYAERRWGVIKPLVNFLLKKTGAPYSTWLLALEYVCYILNRTATPSLNWKTPLEVLEGDTPDISAIMQYEFWEPVYYRVGNKDEISFPSGPPEATGRFVGFASNVGHAMTFKILTEDTGKIIQRSILRTARDAATAPPESDNGSTVPEVVKARHDCTGPDPIHPMETIEARDLVGRTFLMPRQHNGQRFRAKIVEALSEKE